MKTSSQERNVSGAFLKTPGGCFLLEQVQSQKCNPRNFKLPKFLFLFVLPTVLCLATTYGASADPFDDLMTTDDKSGAARGGSYDAQSRMDLKRDELRHLRDLRERREAKDALLEKQQRDNRSLYDLLDGSEFGKKSFMDTYFGKHDYTDLSSTDHKVGDRPDDTSVITHGMFDKSDDEKTAEFYRREKMKLDMREKDRDKKIWDHLTKPDPYVLLDWVPREADTIHNGGFERMPDSGAPVPYHLNGHPDFERKLPWAVGD